MLNLSDANQRNQSGRAQSSAARRLRTNGDGLYVLQGDAKRGAGEGGENLARQLQSYLCGGDKDGLVRTMKLEDIEWSVRARNALSANGISSIAELYDVDGLKMSSWRAAGQVTFREILHQLLSRGIRPPWMVKVCSAFHYDSIEEGNTFILNENPPAGYMELTNGYTQSVFWMMECVIADLNRGGIKWCLKPGMDGLAVWRSGGVEIASEE